MPGVRFCALTGAIFGVMIETEPNGSRADYLPDPGALPGTAFHYE